jgi:ATP-binding cassette subfamily B protein
MEDSVRPARDTPRAPVLGVFLWRLLFWVRPYARRMALGLLANAAARFFDLLPLVVVGRVVDRITLSLQHAVALDVADFLVVGGTVVATFAGLAFFQSASDYLLDSVAQKIRHDLRVALYDHLQKLHIGYFESRQTGDIMAVLASDVDNLERFFSDTSTSIVRLIITFVGIYGSLLLLDPYLAGLLLLPLPFAIAAVRFFVTKVAPQYRRARQAVGAINAILENNIQGMPVIQAFCAQKVQTERILQQSAEYRDAAIAAARSRARFVPLLYGVAGVGYGLLIGVGGWMTWAGVGPSLGDFTTFVLMAMRLVLPLFVFGALINQIQQSEASAARIVELLETAPAIRDSPQARPLVGALEELVLEDVCFGYPGRGRVLCHISARLERGKMLGVVGHTGAGKSSLAKLLLRYFEPDSGRIVANGQPLAEVSLDSWRQRIGYVPQDPYLFHGTVAENIALGREGSSAAAIVQAARLAGAHEFILNLPQGYETVVGERGVRLSGGQRQRISLARAMLRDPELLLLDEATSSVDTRTEAIIQENLHHLRGQRMTVIIAHRLSTVRHCDEIVVLVDGIIVERGTHEALVAAGGVYAGLWMVQSGEIHSGEG